jgi:hypothetical protein
MISLNNAQLGRVMEAAAALPVDKRHAFLQRIAAALELNGRRFEDRDLAAAVRQALAGLGDQVLPN